MMKLRDLRQGESAIIHSIQDSELFLKLLEMGCVPGERIRVEKIAPFGDPISILVAGYRLSLRLNEADAILVEKISESSPTY
jgi:Fe2+ transport system protein FeoA